MFGLSLSELVVIGVVALIAVGPQKLPGMLRTLGEWVRKLRILTHEMRAQSGFDDILRSEGIHGGLTELRGLMRGAQFPVPSFTPPVAAPVVAPPLVRDPYENLEIDATKEYPPEGPDAYGALPDDLIDAGEPEPEPLATLEASAAPAPEGAPRPEEAASAPEPAPEAPARISSAS